MYHVAFSIWLTLSLASFISFCASSNLVCASTFPASNSLSFVANSVLPLSSFALFDCISLLADAILLYVDILVADNCCCFDVNSVLAADNCCSPSRSCCSAFAKLFVISSFCAFRF